VGTAIILVGVYFVIYDLIAVFVPIYFAFIPLTDFWMIALPVLGVAVFLAQNMVCQINVILKSSRYKCL
jgi:hypothetical protein